MEYLGLVHYSTLFESRNIYVKILAGIFIFQIILMFIIYIISFIKKDLQKKEWVGNLFLLLVFAVASAPVIFPISDEVHFAIGSLVTMVSFVYLFYELIRSIILKKYFVKFLIDERLQKLKNTMKIFIKMFSLVAFFAYICNSIILILQFNEHPEKRTDIKHFKNTIIENYLYERINKVDEFIKMENAEGKDVYILDFAAAVYNVPLDKYNKNYDMFNLGNFGKQGENGIIQDLKEKDSVVFLIQKKEFILNWQHPKNVTDYVINNYRKIGEIDIYDIFEK